MSLPTTEPRHVALIIETSNAYARGVLAGIRAYVDHRPEWSLYLVEHGRREVDFRWLEGWQGDGVLARIETPEAARAVRALGRPAVDLSAHGHAPELPCVETDDTAIAELAVRHFLDRGLRSLGWVGDDRHGWSVRRRAALRNLAEEQSIDLHEYELGAHPTPRADRARLASWLSELPHPIGVLACYDIAGQEVLAASRLAGLQVPDQVAVLGVDDDDLFCTLTDPPLSSIQPDTRSTGLMAAEMLDRMMSGAVEAPGLRPIHPLGISTRRSSDLVAVADPAVATGLRLIRNAAATGIEVSTIAVAVGLSRRALDQRFVAVLGRTVHAEIRRCRIEAVAILLRDTDLTLEQIARRLCFPHAEYLSVSFKRERGCTPSHYRSRYAGRRREV